MMYVDMLGFGEPCWQAVVDAARGLGLQVNQALVHPIDVKRYNADIPPRTMPDTHAFNQIAFICGIVVVNDVTAQQGHVLFVGPSAQPLPLKGRLTNVLDADRTYERWKFRNRQQYEGVLYALAHQQQFPSAPDDQPKPDTRTSDEIERAKEMKFFFNFG